MTRREEIAAVLAEHADCIVNGNDGPGSGTTGMDEWSCGITVPFLNDLDDAGRAHLADALLASPALADDLRERVEALIARADARVDVEHRLVTTIALRAAVHGSSESAPEVVTDLVEPWGPFEMGGFEGCTDRNPDVCACGTDAAVICRVCGREIEPGELAYSRQWPCYETLPLAHPDQDWDVISWHAECPDLSAALDGTGERDAGRGGQS